MAANMATRATTVPVTARALLRRINRVLAKEDAKIITARRERERQELGHYYQISYPVGGAWPLHIALEDYGRELGVLHSGETLAADE